MTHIAFQPHLDLEVLETFGEQERMDEKWQLASTFFLTHQILG